MSGLCSEPTLLSLVVLVICMGAAIMACLSSYQLGALSVRNRIFDDAVREGRRNGRGEAAGGDRRGDAPIG